jgi:hypothetical protein
MARAEEGPRLPPFPDELLRVDARERVLAFIRGQGIPSRYRAQLFTRWASYVGYEPTRDDFHAVRSDLPLERE